MSAADDFKDMVVRLNTPLAMIEPLEFRQLKPMPLSPETMEAAVPLISNNYGTINEPIYPPSMVEHCDHAGGDVLKHEHRRQAAIDRARRQR